MIEELIKIFSDNTPETHESYLKNLSSYKGIIDRTPNKFLDYHLKNAVNQEQYELAQHIKETAEKRGFILNG